MIRKLAAIAAVLAAMGLTTVATSTSAHADKPPCTGDRHHNCECPPDKSGHNDDDCPVTPPVPVPTGFNIIIGSRHSDRLPGTAGRDAIFAFGGLRDVLIGGAGRDRLYGMRGHDVLRAVDGERDVVNGGSGRDRCVVDAIDVVRNCETIIVR